MAWPNHNPPNGPGWGGPARGNSGDRPAEPFTADSPTRTGAAPLENRDAVEQEYRQRRRAEKRTRREIREDRTQDLEDRLYDVAMGIAPDATVVGVQAARGLHAMWNGQPVSNVNMNATVRRSVEELSDDELIALAGSGESPSGTGEEGSGAE